MPSAGKMQEMRKFFVLFATGFLLFSGWVYFQSRYPAFSGISEAEALPVGVNPIKLAEIKSFLNADKPRILFLYASWCPYCKKQIEGFKYFYEQYPPNAVLAVSTDKKPEQFAQYIAQHNGFPFTPYIYQGGRELVDYLETQGASFSGGIPYFAVFEKGQFKQEFMGLTHPAKFTEITAK